MPIPFTDIETRLLRKVYVDNSSTLSGQPCWIWTGTVTRGGYGQISWGGSRGGKRLVHRVAYEKSIGPIPVGHDVDHLCRHRACVNPAHLEAVSHQENCRRGTGGQATGARNLQKTHCPQGHPYSPENTYRDKYGFRTCKECKDARQRKFRKEGGVDALLF